VNLKEGIKASCNEFHQWDSHFREKFLETSIQETIQWFPNPVQTELIDCKIIQTEGKRVKGNPKVKVGDLNDPVSSILEKGLMAHAQIPDPIGMGPTTGKAQTESAWSLAAERKFVRACAYPFLIINPPVHSCASDIIKLVELTRDSDFRSREKGGGSHARLWI